jgi:hypothetical protein
MREGVVGSVGSGGEMVALVLMMKLVIGGRHCCDNNNSNCGVVEAIINRGRR